MTVSRLPATARIARFQPLLAKHSKSFSLVDSISVGVDRIQRNFEPMRKQVETWQQAELSTVTARMIIYQAFIENELDVPNHLARRVHDRYFEPRFEEFKPRTLWSLSNAFTSALKELDPIPVPGDGQTRRLSRSPLQAELLNEQGKPDRTSAECSYRPPDFKE